MKDNGIKIRKKDKENQYTQMEMYMKENGKMINNK